MSKFVRSGVYRIDEKTACYLGEIDGINIFALKFDSRLHCFYFIDENAGAINKIEKKNVMIYGEDKLPENILSLSGKSIPVDEKAFARFVFTAIPTLPNAAFCLPDKLEELFLRAGIISGESDKIELGTKYRALNPDYCVIKGGSLFRQTDMRESYPDLVLEMTEFDRQEFLSTSAYSDKGKVYLLVKSGESYGGTHFEFNDWKMKASIEFYEYFKGCKMAKHKRIFTIKPGMKPYFDSLAIRPEEIRLLKHSI